MDQFDIIVIGGGSAGSAVAGRLSEDGKRRVCLLEAGPHNDTIRVKTPGFMPFIPEKSNWRFDTVPQKGLNGRIGYQPRGRGLGGSSAINAMVYIRGNHFDYDQWAQLGCTGWSHADVLPYFRRSEGNERGGSEWHGGEGPLNVMDQRWPSPGSQAFVASAAALQLPENDDFNGARQDGFGIYQVTQKGGERWSAARAYLTPRPNLSIRTGALVEKIVVEDGRAVGVQARFGSKREVIRASGGVVLSAGAFGSPQVLMLSGIGPAAHLKDKGIAVVLDKAAVGEDLQDHIDFVASWETGSLDFIGDSLAGTWKMAKAVIEHRLKRTGIMTTCYAEGGGFWRTNPDLPAPDILQPGSSGSRYPVPLCPGHVGRSRPHQGEGARLFDPRLRAAPGKPRHGAAQFGRSGCGPGDRSQLPRRSARYRHAARRGAADVPHRRSRCPGRLWRHPAPAGRSGE